MSSNKILTTIEQTITSQSLYWQSLALISCFVIAYFCYKFAQKFFTKNGYRSLLYPALSLILLSIGFS
ncbi:MAG: hypothetical protein FJX34_04875, partial [Alphaproteobacteria bacterium]|nr:hypothetical protein [Alphaproteobacteria bacterium]